MITIIGNKKIHWYSRKEASQYFKTQYLSAKLNKQDTKPYIKMLQQIWADKNICIVNSKLK